MTPADRRSDIIADIVARTGIDDPMIELLLSPDTDVFLPAAAEGAA